MKKELTFKEFCALMMRASTVFDEYAHRPVLLEENREGDVTLLISIEEAEQYDYFTQEEDNSYTLVTDEDLILVVRSEDSREFKFRSDVFGFMCSTAMCGALAEHIVTRSYMEHPLYKCETCFRRNTWHMDDLSTPGNRNELV